MRLVKLRFPIVVYPSESKDVGAFTAHCLNLDVVADDDTVEGALSKLLETIENQLDAAEAHGADPIQMAPRKYWDMLARAALVPGEIMDRVVNQSRARNTAAPRLGAEQLEVRELQAA